MRSDTIAKSLAIGNPADGVFKQLDVARETRGSVSDVTEEEIVEGIEPRPDHRDLHRDGRRRDDRRARSLARAGRISPDERVVLYITGDGLKTLDAVASRIERRRGADRRQLRRSGGRVPPRRLNGPPHPRRHRMPVTVRIPGPAAPRQAAPPRCSARRAPSAS